MGQLTSFTRSDGQSETYTYDPAGNMTAKTQNGVQTAMRYNAANQLIQSVTGNDTTKYTYDANGNLVRSENAGGVGRYAYNALGLLEQFTREDGYTESYRYNANRLLSEIRTSEGLTTALTWDILYGDGVVIAENQNGQTTNYTYGLERISALSGSTRTEYVYDGRGSVAAELSYNTAWYTVGGWIARKHVTSKSYTPFGEQIGEAASGFGYNGEYYSADTGMIYLRARFYEPEMNRFGQKDVIRGSIADGVSLNRYLYCQSDPVNYADYNGRQMVPVTVADGGGGSSSSRTTSISQAITKAAKTVSSATEIAKKTVDPYASSKDNSASAQSARDEIAALRRANNGNTSVTSESPSVQDVTGNGAYSCGKDTNTYSANNDVQGANWTIAVGAEAAAAFGVRLSLGGQLVFDSKGNVGLLLYNGFGGGTPSASFTFTGTITGAEDIFALERLGLSAGGSFSLGAVGFGAEAVVGDGYGGVTFSGSLPLLSTPLPEAHGEITFTNVIDLTGLLKQFGKYDEVYSFGVVLYEGSVS